MKVDLVNVADLMKNPNTDNMGQEEQPLRSNKKTHLIMSQKEEKKKARKNPRPVRCCKTKRLEKFAKSMLLHVRKFIKLDQNLLQCVMTRRK